MDRKEIIKDIALQAGQLLSELFAARTDSHEADVASQKLIVPQIQRAFPDIPILAEERMEGIDLLSASDDTQDLPPTYWSIDPLDGSAVFDNQCSEWAVSIALIENYQPTLSVVHFPRFNMTVEAEKGAGVTVNGELKQLTTQRSADKWLIGIDLGKAVDDTFSNDVILPLMRKFRYVRNFPGCASCLELLLGHTGLYVTNNHRNWDIAGMALAIQEAGGIVQQLNGEPMDWHVVRMPAFIAAANQELAQLALS